MRDEYLYRHAERIHKVFEKFGFKWGESIPTEEDIYYTLEQIVGDLRESDFDWIETGRILVMKNMDSPVGYDIYVDVGDIEWFDLLW
mgnify:CR=1 FL=1